jgi:pyruvate dehydrogenase E2 component (dihydrolipoamide acetyltransferase)
MTVVDFRLPDMGEGVMEGEIVQWFVQAGDSVAEDDPLVEVMTDKATVTIGAPYQGTVERLFVEVGQVAKVGQLLLRLARSGEGDAPAATAVGHIATELPGASLFGPNPQGADEAKKAGEISYFEDRPLATPATRGLARELGVDLRKVPPSGAGGRVTADDVRASAPASSPDESRTPLREERTPILGLRRTIAKRMHRSKSTAAHFTFVEECDASALVAMRARLAPEAERQGTRVTYLPFVIKAVADALRHHPMLNSAVDEQTNELVLKKYYNIGVATATDAGLVVPVVHDADRRSLIEVAERLSSLSEAARDGSLQASDFRDSTFTITSLGKHSGLLATPILNPPEVGILGIHRIKERPVVRDGEVVVGQVMLLSLSFDHRIVDGHVGAAFAYDVIEILEDPERLSEYV